LSREISKNIDFVTPVLLGWWYPAAYSGSADIKHASGHPVLAVAILGRRDIFDSVTVPWKLGRVGASDIVPASIWERAKLVNR
jgi:hypothetical protein